jgi:hypothetical protein
MDYLKMTTVFLLGILLASIIFATRINEIYADFKKFNRRIDCILNRIEQVAHQMPRDT